MYSLVDNFLDNLWRKPERLFFTGSLSFYPGVLDKRKSAAGGRIGSGYPGETMRISGVTAEWLQKVLHNFTSSTMITSYKY